MANDISQIRKEFHQREERKKQNNKKSIYKIKNFFFGCCNNKGD